MDFQGTQARARTVDILLVQCEPARVVIVAMDIADDRWCLTLPTAVDSSTKATRGVGKLKGPLPGQVFPSFPVFTIAIVIVKILCLAVGCCAALHVMRIIVRPRLK